MSVYVQLKTHTSWFTLEATEFSWEKERQNQVSARLFSQMQS